MFDWDEIEREIHQATPMNVLVHELRAMIRDKQEKNPSLCDVFVSSYIYAEFVFTQKIADFIAAYEKVFRFFGGVTCKRVGAQLENRQKKRVISKQITMSDR